VFRFNWKCPKLYDELGLQPTAAFEQKAQPSRSGEQADRAFGEDPANRSGSKAR
jgi:hypothetical protein